LCHIGLGADEVVIIGGVIAQHHVGGGHPGGGGYGANPDTMELHAFYALALVHLGAGDATEQDQAQQERTDKSADEFHRILIGDFWKLTDLAAELKNVIIVP